MRGLLVALLLCTGCGLCAPREYETETYRTLPLGADCPSAESVGAIAFESREDVPGVLQCCYPSHVRKPALDETIGVYVLEECNSGRCTCPSRDALLGSGLRLLGVPEDATIVAVTSGPTSKWGSCNYQVHVVREERVFAKSRCSTIFTDKGALDVGECPKPSKLLGTDSPLAEEKGETIESVDAPATLAESSIPAQTKCTYRVKGETSSDVCG